MGLAVPMGCISGKLRKCIGVGLGYFPTSPFDLNEATSSLLELPLILLLLCLFTVLKLS